MIQCDFQISMVELTTLAAANNLFSPVILSDAHFGSAKIDHLQYFLSDSDSTCRLQLEQRN